MVDLSETPKEEDEAAFAAALNGTSYETGPLQPFDSSAENPRYARHDGTYYLLDSVIVNQVTVTRPVLRLYETDKSATSPPANTVEAATLPQVDKQAVQIAYFAASARGNQGGAPWGLIQHGGYAYRSDDAIEASDLLGDSSPDYLISRNRVFEVEIARERFDEPVYRAATEPVAETDDRMEAILRAQYVDARLLKNELSPAALEIVETAADGRYSEPYPYSSSYETVLRAMDKRAYLDGNIEKDTLDETAGRRMILYDGVYYIYLLRLSATYTGN